MEKSVSGPIVKCMSCGVWVHLENFSYLWKNPGCFAKCKTFFFSYNTWAKISGPKQSTKNHMTVSPAHPIEMSKDGCQV